MHDVDFNDDGDTHWLNDNECLSSHRMSRKTMKKLIDMTKHRPLFQRFSSGILNEELTEKAARKHLIHFMHFLGTHGEGVTILIVETGLKMVMVRMKNER